jgi:2-phosphosulfolactate phosphatase
VAVIGAGERWPDGSLRPALEDQWGAGGLIHVLRAGGWSEVSPEAQAAADAFTAITANLAEGLTGCASGRELLAAGHPDDVRIAAELDSSAAVPILRGDAFTAA